MSLFLKQTRFISPIISTPIHRSLTTIRDNILDFKIHNLTSVDFQLHNHHVTKGMQFSGIHPYHHHSLKVRSQCCESKEVAHWFNDKVHMGAAVAINIPSDYILPTRLNFAIHGNLILTIDDNEYTLNDIVIGHGTHLGTHWWIGGNGKHYKRSTIYDSAGNRPALRCHLDSNNAELIFTACTKSIPNGIAAILIKD